MDDLTTAVSAEFIGGAGDPGAVNGAFSGLDTVEFTYTGDAIGGATFAFIIEYQTSAP